MMAYGNSSLFKMEFYFPSVSILLGSVLFFALMAIKLRKRSHKSNLPPGPRPLPIIGNMHLLMSSSLMHHRFRELSIKYGPLMHLKLGEVSHMVISSAEIAEQVMKTYDLNFCQRPKTVSAAIISYDCKNVVFAPHGDYWRQLRRICTLELLSVKRVQSFRYIREELVSNLVKSISSDQVAGSSINLSKMIFTLSFEITSRSAFGMEFEDLDQFISTTKKMVGLVSGLQLADFFPSAKLLHSISGLSSELKRLHRGLDKVLQNIIDQHMAKDREGDQDEREDIVDVLLNLREHGNLELLLTIDNIKAVIMDLFIAGSDTSSTTVDWAMSELMRNPRVMKKAQEEVRRVFKNQGNVSESGIDRLEYLKLVIKETLRLHPPLPLLIPRECKERCDINGYEIPAKSRIMINAWAIARDPRHWTEPECFWPERFIDSPTDYSGTHFEFTPFGAGRRICPGIPLGLANVELLLAQLLYHFDWMLPSGNIDMTEKFGAVVGRKTDLYLVPVPYHPPTV